MTQAPTPGPLSVFRVDLGLVATTIETMHRRIEDLAGSRQSQYDGAVALARDLYLSAPTAPVEASGSERDFETAEAMAEAWADRVEIQHMVDVTSAVFAKWASPELLSRFRQQMMAVIQQAYIEGVGARVEAVRPQPSGETREAVARVSHRQAAHHAEVGTDPMTAMLRDIDERLNRDSPDIPGARVAIHGARLAAAYSALETGK